MATLPDDIESSIEDLDPEPAQRGWTRWREVVLGVLLVLGVLGWSGWSWWQQQRNESNYRIAQEAAIRRDWDVARMYYADTPGYKDADSKATQAGKMIADRDTQYAIAMTSAQKEEWATSLKALKTVNGIEPHYRDADRLTAQSEKEVDRAALLGAVAMRTRADPPGLYYMSEDGWQYLEGSNRASEVVGWGDLSHIVYNVPGEGRLMAATIKGGKLDFMPLGMDPDLYFGYIWSKHGVWGLYQSTSSGQVVPSSIGRSGFGSFDATYQPFTSSTTVRLREPGPMWAIGDISPETDQVLLIDLSAFDQETNPMTYLYIASGDGSNRRLLYSSPGGFKGVRFGPTGDYVIAHTYKLQPDSGKERQAIVLLDLKGNRQPSVLAQGLTPTNIGYGTQTPVSAAFVEQGTYAGKILVSEWSDYDDTFTLIDPDRPGVSIMKNTLHDVDLPSPSAGIASFDRSWIGYSSPDDLLLAWQNTKKYTWNAFDSMTTIALSATGPPRVAGWQLADNVTLVIDSWVRDGNLVYLGVSHSPSEHTYSIHSLPLSGAGNEQIRASAIYTTTKEGPDPVYPEPTWYLGPQMLADASDGNLHVRTYDGQIDLMLEPGVTSLESLDPYESRYARR